MIGIVEPLNDEGDMPEYPDQPDHCGSLPEAQATQFPLKKSSPAQLLAEAGEGMDRDSSEKTLQQGQENRPGEFVRLDHDPEMLGFKPQVPEGVLLVRGESHSG